MGTKTVSKSVSMLRRIADFKFFEIDETQLDVELKKHSKRYFDSAVALADYKEILERRKAALDLVEAELDADIRSNPEAYNIKRVSEGAIKAKIRSRRKYAKAAARVLRAKHNVDVVQAAVNALEHRKRCLEKLVDLFLANYFSEPRIKERGDLQDRTKDKIRRRGRRGRDD